MLKECIEQNYNLVIETIVPAKRGAYGETWNIVTKGRNYFAKVHYMSNKMERYKVSLGIVDYLYQQNITFINHVIKTRENTLYVEYGGGVLALFDYIEGENSKQYEVTDLLHLLTEVYQKSLPDGTVDKEDFNIYCADFVLSRQKEYPIISSNIETLKCYYDRLQNAREKCKTSRDHMYITHGDSASNIMMQKEQMIIIDWDNVKVASPERDLWFMIHSVSDVDRFNKILLKDGIDYQLRGERLRFYCYYNYFYYFQDHLLAIEETSDSYQKRRILNYIHFLFFGGYILEQMYTIEKIQLEIGGKYEV